MTNIKTISLNGFKSYNSFKECSIEFSPKINLIVGDNGCGKSNLFEAFMYVLSCIHDNLDSKEKAKLVSEASNSEANMFVELFMSNPNGALGSDKKKIGFKRMFTKNKGDEFLIDSKKYSKQVFREMLEQGGISCKTPYFYIKQETINELVMMTDLQLLDFISQAIGIKSFHEKKESLNIEILLAKEKKIKLNASMAKLNTYLGDLDKQNKAMDVFDKLNKKKLGLEGTLLKRKKDSHQKILEELEVKQKEVEKVYNKKIGDCKEFQENQKELISSLGQINSQIAELNHQLGMLKVISEEKKAKNYSIEEENKRKENYKNELELSMTNTQNQLKKLNETIKSNESVLEDEKKKLPKLNKEIEELEQKCNGKKTQRDELVSLVSLSNEKKSKSESLERAIAGLKDTLEKLTKSQQILEKEIDSNTESKGKKEKQLKQCILTIQETEDTISKCEKAVQTINVSMNEISTKCKRIENEHEIHNKSLTELIKLKDEKEAILSKYLRCNYSIFVEFIAHLNTLNMPNYLGVFIDLIEVPREYRAAFDMFGANLIFSILVKDLATAGKIVEEAETERFQSLVVNVICLEMMSEGKKVAPDLENGKYLTSFIMCKNKDMEKEVSKVLKSTLRKVVIVESMSVALDYSKNHKLHCFCSKNLKAIYSGGYAGSAGTNDINFELFSLSEQSLRLNKEINNRKELLSKLATELKESNDSFAKASAEMNNNKIELIEATKDLKMQERTKLVFEAEIKSLGESIQSEEIQKANIISDYSTAKNSLESQTKLLSTIGTIKLSKDNAGKLSEANMEIRTLQDEIMKHVSQQRDATRTIETITNQNKSCHQQIELLEKKLTSISAEFKSIMIQSVEIESEEVDIESKANELNSFIKNRDSINKEISSITSSIEKIKIDIPKQNSEMDRLYLSIDELKYSIEEIEIKMKKLKVPPLETSIDDNEIIEAIEDIKTKSKEHQTMEIEAIKLYNSLNESKAKIIKQTTEIESAIDKLQEFFKKLEEQEEAVFFKETKAISESFNQIIRSIIPNSKGAISLIPTQNDVLSQRIFSIGHKSYDGATIEVTILGQKQLVSHLSGGQKTAVALSLLFSIQEKQPSPIYIFDEVDAALDTNSRANYFRL